MEREDGEMSEEESMVVDEEDFVKKEIIEPQKDLAVLYKAEKDGLIIKTLEKVDACKLEERAKRFGINLTGHRIITQKQIDELYANFGIESGNERHFRFDTLHLRGVDGLTSREIFEYLEDYKPVSLEWIDGASCNVVCTDHISTALALLVHSREIRDPNLKNMIDKSSTYHWREGMPHEKKDFMLMRFATKSDKKDITKKHEPKRVFERLDIDGGGDSVSKNPWGDLCQTWGVYDHQEILSRKAPTDSDDESNLIPTVPVQIKNRSLAKRLGKRSHKSEGSDSDSDSKWTKRQKAPRMRMHADDEESKRKKKETSPVRECEEKDSFAPLSIELYKAEKDGLIIKTLEKVDACKLEERAKRFGINLTGHRIITQKQIDELYANFGIESGNERHFRFDTLHLRGVDGLTSREIFEYLEDYKPVSLEWIDGASCNVVCTDHISTALALLVHSREIRDPNLKNMIDKSSTYHWREGMPHEKKDFMLMRFATKSDKKDITKKHEPKRVFERLDIDGGGDSVSKNPWGDLCQTWGVYDHQEILSRKAPTDSDDESNLIPTVPVQIKNRSLAKRLGKRSHKSEGSDSDSDSKWTKRQKAPRMRMHADDEESKRKKKETSPVRECEEKDSFAPLSIEVVNTNFSYSPKEVTKLSDKFRCRGKTDSVIQKDGVHSRLGLKILATDRAPAADRAERDRGWSSDESSSKPDHDVMSRVQIVGKKKHSSDVWSRLQTHSEKSSNDDLRTMLKSRKPQKSSDLKEKKSSDLREKKSSTLTKNKSSDLRARIGKSKEGFSFKSKEGVSLRVEIDNDYHLRE